jgi:hypothetical protein
MNMIRQSTHCLAIAALLLLCAMVLSTGALAEVYKTVDKDGNVVYTDRPPTPDAEPEVLRELSVIPRPKYEKDAENETAEAAETGAPSLGDLRRQYRNFRLTRPTAEQTFWGTGNIATIGWDAGASLQPGMLVRILLNGSPMGEPTTQSVVATPPLDRGEYTAKAELLAPNGRVIASSENVKFFIKQQFQGGG